MVRRGGPALLCWRCCASLSAAGCSASSPGNLSSELFGVKRMSPRNPKQLQMLPIHLFERDQLSSFEETSPKCFFVFFSWLDVARDG